MVHQGLSASILPHRGDGIQLLKLVTIISMLGITIIQTIYVINFLVQISVVITIMVYQQMSPQCHAILMATP